MGKLRHKNKFFVVPIFVIILNYIALGTSFHIQSNTGWSGNYNIFGITGLAARMTAIRISEISLIAIVLLLIIQIVFICISKINWSEFMIWFALNLVALIACFFVIVARI